MNKMLFLIILLSLWTISCIATRIIKLIEDLKIIKYVSENPEVLNAKCFLNNRREILEDEEREEEVEDYE